ncbi:hypothetical protein M427DRAFT_100778, partial [Gonapodya prolifera JEL478]
ILTCDMDHLMAQLLKQFCEVILEAGSPVSVIGFIDGTDHRISWPTHKQQRYYSGQKRQHCLKYQGVVSPDRIIPPLAGPFFGPDHNLTIFRRSGLNDLLVKHGTFPPLAFRPAHEPYEIYGDPAYLPGGAHLAGPWKLAHLTAEQQEYNSRNRAVCVSIDWALEKPATLFAFLNYYRSLKVELSPVGTYYCIGILLTNAHTCLLGSQTEVWTYSPDT